MQPPDSIYTDVLTLFFGLMGIPLAVYGAYRIGAGDRDGGTVGLTLVLGGLWLVALGRVSGWLATAAVVTALVALNRGMESGRTAVAKAQAKGSPLNTSTSQLNDEVSHSEGQPIDGFPEHPGFGPAPFIRTHGWQEDPSDPNLLRWWTGTDWGSSTKPKDGLPL